MLRASGDLNILGQDSPQGFRFAGRSAALAAALLVSGSFVTLHAQIENLPDSQIEANVLKAVAGTPDLAVETISTNTTHGVVTLSGSVRTEAARAKAETVASTTPGVKKVVDELTIDGDQHAPVQSAQQPAGMVLRSDGTYAPAEGSDGQAYGVQPAGSPSVPTAANPVQRNDPEADQTLDQQMDRRANPQYNNPAPGAHAGYPTEGNYPQQPQRYPQQAPSYPQQAQGYPQQPGYPQQAQGYPSQQPGYPNRGYSPAPNGGQPPVWGGQPGGQSVVVPSGVMVRVRVNRTLSSNHTQPGTPFDGTVLNDVTADGFIAIPRGASVQGKVLDAKASGALSGRGELSLQLTQLTIGGRTYPIVSDVWAHNGGDKTIETINKTAGIGALGAVFGALAGGGIGAAVGGGIGAAAGVASSATSPNGQIIIPSEGVVTFHLAQTANVQTVSEQEMQRLAYGIGPNAEPRGAGLARRYPPVAVYPGYYPYGYPGGPYGPGPYGYPAQP